MKIAQIAPLAESVPPHTYGGTERVVSYLTEELVAQGHKVTLFASGDSSTSAELEACAPRALRSDPRILDPVPHHVCLIERVRRRAREFDILHFHIDLLQFPLLREMDAPAVTTLHGRLDLPDLAPFYVEFSDMPLVSISDDQRAPMPPVTWAGRVHHGLPRDLLRFSQTSRGYLAFLGRLSPEKRPDRAVAIASAAGLPLKIAAKIDVADREYWETTAAPCLRGTAQASFLGEIGEHEKSAFLGGAVALLFPIDWPEPFGLVLIEAMACGTPVIAFRHGAVPEIVEDGVTGFIVDTVEQAVAAVPLAASLDRRAVRARFEERFTARRMARDYVEIYETLLAGPVTRLPEIRRTGS